jgi:hypothetical protein
MSTPSSPVPELCAAEYTATRVPGLDGPAKIFITAQGVHPTSGYSVMFHTSPLDVYPPEFSLWHIKPAGRSLDVLTPFTALTAFDESKQVQNVVVVDAAGRTEVPVKPIGAKLLHK